MELVEIILFSLLVAGIWFGAFYQNRCKGKVDPKELGDFFKYKY